LPLTHAMAEPGDAWSGEENESDIYIGSLKSYSADKGFGFIECEAATKLYSRDVFVHRAEFLAAGCPPIGSQVKFCIVLNARQQPQCVGLAVDRFVVAQTLQTLRKQVEWYFSDASLCTDEFFYKKASESPDGWVSTRWLGRCRRIMDLKVTTEMIYESLQDSHLEMKRFCNCNPCTSFEDHLYIRRRQPLPPFVGQQFKTSDGMLADSEPSSALDLFKTMNRLQDQRQVQNSLGLKEIGNDSTIFREVLRLPNSDVRAGPVIAQGYERIVYGDAGPYIEFNSLQICWSSWPYMNEKSRFGDLRCYDEFFTESSYKKWQFGGQAGQDRPTLMLYAQTKSVANKTFAPNTWSVGRECGYADYRAGYFYVAADSFLVAVDGMLPEMSPVEHTFVTNIEPPTSTEHWDVCWQWRQGKCYKGDACTWRHAW